MEEDLALVFVAYGRERILSSWLKSMVLKVCSGDSGVPQETFKVKMILTIILRYYLHFLSH